MNRLITSADDPTYGDKINAEVGLKEGDLLVTSKDDKNRVHYYFMISREFQGLKDGGTIWIDGDALGEVDMILFRNGPTDTAGWGHAKNITIRPIPGTQVKASHVVCSGLLNAKILGSSNVYPGLSALEKKKFLSGNFGFHIKGKPTGGHGFALSVLDGGACELEGFEVQYGFSGVRFAPSKIDVRNKLKAYNGYPHDTGDGELFYFGDTDGVPPSPKVELEMYDIIGVRAACEFFQGQNMLGSDIHNIILASGQTAWIAAFQAFQSTALQAQPSSGLNKIYNIIVDGFGTVGLNPFGSMEDSANPIKQFELFNYLFNDGRSIGHYLHNSGKYGMNWHFHDGFYRAFNNANVRTGNKPDDYICSNRNGTDQYKFSNINFDKSRLKFFQGVMTGITAENVNQVDSLPGVKYVNSGFTERMANIFQWRQFWGKYHPITTAAKLDIPVDYSVGQVVIDEQEHAYYKVAKNHISDANRPANNPNMFRLKWDENGVRNDSPNYTSTFKQYDYPPDDLRLAADDHWRAKGFGYLGKVDDPTVPVDDLDDYAERVIAAVRAVPKRK